MRTTLLDRALSFVGLERRAYNAQDPSWNHPLISSGPAKAESLSAAYACVAAISETIASLPLILYKRTADDGRERAPENPLYRVLHDQANELQTALEFREMMQANTLLRGNAHAEIIRGNDGQVTALVPLLPGRVTTLQLDNDRLAYDVTDTKGRVRRLLQHEVLHLRHRSDNGLVGVSPITASRETFELALSERDHGNSTYTNGTRLSGILKFKQSLKPEQLEQIRETWHKRHAGTDNSGRIAITYGDVDYVPTSMSMEDAQWLESRQFSVEEIARLFRVPPTIIGDLRHGNYSNSVEMNRVFVVHTLRRHMTMWEQAISSSLLTPASRQLYFAEHSVEGLLRGDSTNRADFYSKGIADGWLLIDEVRKYENLPKLPPRQEKPEAGI
ncbi:phage portal protein, HK97 family [Nitrosospira sp. Nsp18]|uniref:phage portal protein n=1 Tax=Nitrosospira sp. Nsp18 TaxID=1855334 RepID=UPI000881D523|nr:phage portal protein [Nitrosospira sp. Nsp18]SDA27091.1 phage portal protein, HK97 family [Nitrosospira sp. Nsp18]